MDRKKLSEAIVSRLELDMTPIGIAFLESAPAGVPTFGGEVPSACTFWRRAESQVFFAPAEKHYNCPVGAMTMGFELPKAVKENLMQVVGNMLAAQYLSPQEPEKIPAVARPKRGILYGPLRDYPVDPDLILLWLTPRQAMLCNEAVGRVQWTESSASRVLGRPACAALPVALASSEAALSLGCTGMRTFTGIGAERMLGVLPAARAEAMVGSMELTAASNQTMKTFYEGHKASFA